MAGRRASPEDPRIDADGQAWQAQDADHLASADGGVTEAFLRPALTQPWEITESSYSHPDTFVGEPLIFWAARLMLIGHRQNAYPALEVQKLPGRAISQRDAWTHLAAQPINHLLQWPDDANDRLGLWRAGQHSWAFRINPGFASETLANYFKVPQQLPGPSDAREIEGLKILFDFIPPQALFVWRPEFHRPLHAQPTHVGRRFDGLDLQKILAGNFSSRVVVARPLVLSGPHWVKQLDPSVVRIARPFYLPQVISRETFTRWQPDVPSEILEALPPVMRVLLEQEPIVLNDAVRRLIALCALPNLAPDRYGLTVSDGGANYNAYEMRPRGDNSNLLSFIADSIPAIDEFFIIVVAEGIYMEVHGELMHRLGQSLQMMVQEAAAGLHKIINLHLAQNDYAGLAGIFARLDDWCFNGQVRVIEEILLELGEAVLAPDAIVLPAFHPADSDRDKAAKLAGALRRAELRRFAQTQDRSITDVHLGDAPEFTQSYFNRQNLGTFLRGQQDIADRSQAGIEALLDYLADDLLIFG